MANHLLEKAFAKETLLACRGYIPSFIKQGKSVGYSKVLTETMKKSLPIVEGNADGVLHYTNLSVLYDSDRKVPFFSVYNIDGSKKSTKVVRANSFKPDPRIPTDIQLSQAGFYNLITSFKEFEIGHMAANNEMAWGDDDDAQLKAYQTFHFTNSSPQALKLNTGLWKTLETYIINEAATIESDKRICVFTGPLLLSNDPAYVKDTSFKIPLLFFKVIVFMSAKGMYSTAFMMSHEQKLIEDHMFVPAAGPTVSGLQAIEAPVPFEDFKYKKVFQVNISLLERLSGMNFTWRGVKTVDVPNDMKQVKKIKEIKDAKDAAGQEKVASRPSLLKQNPSPKEIKKSTYKLNIILP